jgi:hypothetical protein
LFFPFFLLHATLPHALTHSLARSRPPLRSIMLPLTRSPKTRSPKTHSRMLSYALTLALSHTRSQNALSNFLTRPHHTLSHTLSHTNTRAVGSRPKWRYFMVLACVAFVFSNLTHSNILLLLLLIQTIRTTTRPGRAGLATCGGVTCRSAGTSFNGCFGGRESARRVRLGARRRKVVLTLKFKFNFTSRESR